MYIYSVIHNKLLKSFLVFLPNITDRIMATPALTVAAVPSAQAQEAFRDQNGGPLATKQLNIYFSSAVENVTLRVRGT